MADDLRFDAKAGFIVALFAAIIAFNFLGLFNQIKTTVGIDLNLIFNVMLVFLFLSVYFYALDYARTYSTTEWKFLRHFRSIGNIFYVFSLLILPFSFLVYFVIYLIKIIPKIPASDITTLTSIISGIAGVILSMISYIIGRRITSRQTNEAVKDIQNTEEDVMNKAVELFKNKFYAASLLEMGKLIEIALQKKLLKEKNLQVQRTSLGKLLELAEKYELIDLALKSGIEKIKIMRNKAAHLDIEFTKKDAEQALNETNKFLQILDPKTQW